MALSRTKPHGCTMTPSRYQLVEETFHRAADLDGDERRAVLLSACADDASLLQEVESLLDADAQAGAFLPPHFQRRPRPRALRRNLRRRPPLLSGTAPQPPRHQAFQRAVNSGTTPSTRFSAPAG